MIELDLALYFETLSLSKEVKNKLMRDIDCRINKDLPKELPKYQTNPDLFDNSEPHWVDLKNSIYEKVSKYYSVDGSKTVAWAYVQFANEEEDLQRYSINWHSHSINANSRNEYIICSAIFYLNVPDSLCTTEFRDKHNNVFIPKFVEQMLIVHDSTTPHRPALWLNRGQAENRYVLAVDYVQEK